MQTPDPQFRIAERNGQASLWVVMPDGTHFNIWDIPHKELTSNALDAIKSAFFRGMIFQRKFTLATLQCSLEHENNEWDDRREMLTNQS
jgi:hypothetical protein